MMNDIFLKIWNNMNQAYGSSMGLLYFVYLGWNKFHPYKMNHAYGTLTEFRRACPDFFGKWFIL